MLKRIGPFASIIIALFYLLALYLFVTIKPHKNHFVSVCSETLLVSTSQYILLLVGFDTLIYQKYCDRSPTLVGHQDYFLAPLPGSKALLVRKSFIASAVFIFACCSISLWSLLSLKQHLETLFPLLLWQQEVLHLLKVFHLNTYGNC